MKNNLIYAGSRNQGIDFIRGIALLGILLINIQTYALFAFLNPEQVYALQLDKPENYAPAQFFVHLFIKGQFYTIFCFVFGLSFYLIYTKSLRRGLNARRIYRRRLWILLGIGLVHAFVFWFGDVLHKYALLGFSLPYFYHKSIRTILKWIAGIALLIVSMQIFNALFFIEITKTYSEPQIEISDVIMHVINVWKSGSVVEVVSVQWLGVVMLYARNLENGLVNFAHYEIMFLLGIVAGKLNTVWRPQELRLQLVRLGLFLFPAAILLKAISCLSELQFLPGLGRFSAYESIICSLAQFISIPLLSLVYLAELGLVLQNKSSWFITAIAKTGRMSLTNYLMQTVICMLLFYGYAGGLSGKLTLLESLTVALLIYIFQVIFSSVWLSYYDDGPLEGRLRYRFPPKENVRKPQKVEI